MNKNIIGLFLLCSILLVGCAKDANAPTVILKYPELNLKVGDTYNPTDYITANDLEGEVDITIKENNVDMTTQGEYFTVFEVKDGGNNIVQATMKVKVGKELTKEEKQAIKLVEQLKKIIKNPDTLVINSIEICKTSSGAQYPKIECSYTDGFDITMDHTYYTITMLDDGTVSMPSFSIREDWYVPIAKRNWSECYDAYANEASSYVAKIDLDRIKVEIDKL